MMACTASPILIPRSGSLSISPANTTSRMSCARNVASVHADASLSMAHADFAVLPAHASDTLSLARVDIDASMEHASGNVSSVHVDVDTSHADADKSKVHADTGISPSHADVCVTPVEADVKSSPTHVSDADHTHASVAAHTLVSDAALIPASPRRKLSLPNLPSVVPVHGVGKDGQLRVEGNMIINVQHGQTIQFPLMIVKVRC